MLKRLCVCAFFALVGFSVSADVAIFQGQTHEERFVLPQHQFVTLEVEQFDIDLEAKVLEPAGKAVVRGLLEYEPGISFITRDAGTYRLVLEAHPLSSQLGTVRIAVAGSRPAKPEDDRRMETQRAFYDAAMLLLMNFTAEEQRHGDSWIRQNYERITAMLKTCEAFLARSIACRMKAKCATGCRGA